MLNEQGQWVDDPNRTRANFPERDMNSIVRSMIEDRPDWNAWREMDSWELCEAVLLMFRQNPTSKEVFQLRAFERVGMSGEGPPGKSRIWSLAKRAINAGILPATKGDDGQFFVRPGEFLAWFKEQTKSIPPWYSWRDPIPDELRDIPIPATPAKQVAGNFIPRQVAIARFLDKWEGDQMTTNAAGKRIDERIRRGKIIARGSGKGREIETTSLDAFILRQLDADRAADSVRDERNDRVRREKAGHKGEIY